MYTYDIISEVPYDEKDIISKELEKLGYKPITSRIENFLFTYGKLKEYQYLSGEVGTDKVKVPYNRELIIALASMRSDKRFHEGEMVVRTNQDHLGMKSGDIATIEKSSGVGIQLKEYKANTGRGTGTHDDAYFRKATAEEIIAHYTKKAKEKPFNHFSEVTYEMITTHPYFKTLSEKQLDEVVAYMNFSGFKQLQGEGSTQKTKILFKKLHSNTITKTNMKEIIGYKLKDSAKQYEKAAAKIIHGTAYTGKLNRYSGGYNFNVGSDAYTTLKEAGVLDLWFEPVYKDSYKVGDYVYCLESGKNHSNHPQYKMGQGMDEGDVDEIVALEEYEGHTVAVTKTKAVIRLSEHPHAFRKATKEEYEEKATITLGGYKVQKGPYGSGDADGHFGCFNINGDDLRFLIRLLRKTEAHAELKIKGVEVTVEALNKILKVIS